MTKEEALEHRWKEIQDALPGKKLVFGEGWVNARLAIVGEAPGREEEKFGRPFVGSAGLLLNQLLREADLRRQDVWITNVVKWWPTQGGVGFLTRAPTAKEVQEGTEWLKRELEIIGCSLVLALGNTAARTLVDKNFKMTQQHGQWYPGKWGQQVLVTFHPAYVLRQLGDDREKVMRLIRTDMQKLKEKYAA